MSIYDDDISVGAAYSFAPVVYVGPDAAHAERIRLQQEQIEFLSAQSTRLISEAKSLERQLTWKANIIEDQQARDKRLVFHIERTEALRKLPSFLSPVRRD